MLQKKYKSCKWRRRCNLYQKQKEMAKDIKLFPKQSKIRKTLTKQDNGIFELLIWWGAW